MPLHKQTSSDLKQRITKKMYPRHSNGAKQSFWNIRFHSNKSQIFITHTWIIWPGCNLAVAINILATAMIYMGKVSSVTQNQTQDHFQANTWESGHSKYMIFALANLGDHNWFIKAYTWLSNINGFSPTNRPNSYLFFSY